MEEFKVKHRAQMGLACSTAMLGQYFQALCTQRTERSTALGRQAKCRLGLCGLCDQNFDSYQRLLHKRYRPFLLMACLRRQKRSCSGLGVRCAIDQYLEAAFFIHIGKHRRVGDALDKLQLGGDVCHLVFEKGSVQLRRIEAQQHMATGA